MTEERRAHPRYEAGPGACMFEVVSVGGPKLGHATPEDVSAGGALLSTERPLPLGETIVLEVQPPHPLAGRRLPFQVLRCVELGNGSHLLAGMFVPRLSDADARSLSGDMRSGS